MKLIKMKNGFVNVNMIESFAVIEHETCCDIVAYSPSYGGDCECYILGKCEDESDAWIHLEALDEWLTDDKDGVYDVMRLWEGYDNDT